MDTITVNNGKKDDVLNIFIEYKYVNRTVKKEEFDASSVRDIYVKFSIIILAKINVLCKGRYTR